jgi:hypothetical protein
MKVQIKPVTKISTEVELNIVVFTDPIENNRTKASATVKLLGEGIFDTKSVIIEADEYDAWGSDDNYIYDLILSKVGLERN